MALGTCPDCKEPLSTSARNCPRCGWHKSAAPIVIGWIIAIAIVIFVVVCYYQINEVNKAEENLRRELAKPIP